MNPSYLEKYGLGLISNNYKIIPIKKGSKIPAVKGWTKIDADINQLEQWISAGHEGVGVLCKNNPAVDIDILDEEVSRQMVKAVLQKFPGGLIREGKAPKTLLAYRTDKPFKKVRSKTYEDMFSDHHAVEILGDGQQYVAYAEHPDILKPYMWHGDGNGAPPGIFEVESNSLTIFNLEDARAVVSLFEEIATEKVATDGWVKVKDGTNGSQTDVQGVDIEGDVDEIDFANIKPRLGLDDGAIRRALASIAKPTYYFYENWVKVGMALWHETNGSEEGLEYWVQWSEQDPNFKSEEDCRSRWPGFRPSRGSRVTTMATVLKWAKKEADGETKICSRPISIDFLELRKKLGPINWLVKGFIEQNTTGLFFGDPGSYKSFLAMDIAYHCASGKNWHGSTVVKGPVYYIAGEGHGGIVRRQEAWIKHHKPDLSSMHFKFTTEAMNFYEAKSAELITRDIEEWAETAGNPVLIVIDTLARNFNGDENSAGEMGTFINNVNQYLRVPFECVVLIVHHTGHTEKKRARGSMALKAGVDFEYRVEKSKTVPFGAELSCTKMKDAVEPDEAWFEGGKIKLNFPEDGEEQMTSLVFEKTDVVEQERQLSPKLTQFLELANSLADPEGIVDRVQLRERAVADEVAKDFPKVRGFIKSLKGKNMIEVIDATQIRLKDLP